MAFPKPTDHDADSPHERTSILLADDDPADLASLREILGDIGQALVVARSGEEALGRARAQEFAAILLDVRLPGSGGFETAQAMRADERHRVTPIIFLAEAGIGRAQIERGYALGAIDVLERPLSTVVVRAKVRGLVTLIREKERAKHEADQLRMLVQGTTDYAIFMLDPRGHVATWNAGAERLKGYTAAEIVGQHFSRFYPQDALDRGWPDHELRAAEAEGRFEDEGWRLRKDGSRFWANVVITALRDDQGRLRGFSKVTRDLTARKQAEESLRRSEERFRLLVEGTTDYAIFMLDPRGHVTTWNAGAERLKGYTAAEIVGQHFSRFYPREAIDRGWPDHELRVAAAEGRFEDEGWRVRKDGTLFWANVVITALRGERGDLLGFSKITRDMTQRKRAEEDARRLAEETAARRVVEENARLVQRERERLQVTLASIGDAVISTDARGCVEYLNPVAEELVGWRAGEAAGRGLEEVFRIVNEDTRRPVENPALRALRDGKIVGLANHTVLISKDGTERPIDDSAAPIRNERGDISGSVLVFRDISERRRNEAALAERMRLLALNASVGEALVQGDELGSMLRRCAEALVEHLDGAFARIWTLDQAEGVLELRASAGMYTHLDGPHGRVRVGEYKIGLIALERRPHLTNAVVGDPRVGDQDWAEREGMAAFAGYPLLVDGRLVAVMAMFARHELSEATLEAMASVADEIAVGIERKSAQERLEEQRELLSVTLASIGDAVIATDDRGRVTFLNGVAQDLTGRTQADAVGRPLDAIFVIINERTRRPVENPVEKVLREGVIVGLGNHTVLVAGDGAEQPIDDTAAPIRDSAGRLIGVVLVFRDVTEQRRAEQQRDARLAVTHVLGESGAVGDGVGGVLRAVCENLGWDVGLFWSVDGGGEELACRQTWHRPDVVVGAFVESSCSRTFGKGAGLPGRVWASGEPSWILDVARDSDFPRLAAAAGHGLGSALACPVVVGDRTLGVIEFFTRSIREPGTGLLELMGTVGGSLGHFLVRNEVEDELRRSEQELADFFDNATVGLHWVGPDGIILRANQAELDMLGYGRGEYVGRPIADIHADQDVICDILGRLKAGEKLVEYPARLLCKDGSIKDVLIDSSVLWRDGKFVHTRCFTRDVSERRKHEEERERLLAEAEAASQAKTQFLAVLSHELRTPLNPILLAASSMLERPSDPAEFRPTLEMIRQNVNLQARLIDDLLDVMRIVRGKMPLHWEVADGHKLIDQAIRVCRSEVLGKQLRLEADLAAPQRHVNADPARLQQVFWNLIKNAVKFTPEGGSIAVRSCNEAGDDGGRIVFEVSDTGIGIEPEVLPTIWDPFQQGETTITRKFGGLGLGLAICKGIVEAHGGTIAAESAGPGRGTTFRVSLKALPEPAEDAGGEPVGGPVDAGTARPSTLRILVVEDEPATLRLMARLLRGLGHEVETAGTIASALEAVEAGTFDLIVSDIGLPDGSGLDLMRRALARRGAVTGIALTGYGMEEDIRRSREAGFTAHLTKPIDFAKLEAMIRQVAG